ncbi:RNA-directed DNA polymerase from mobile element jockey [Trichonephila clavipes]|nr:RNA-directed DNA polymerase from mobile element jockey [Trichonephila clavipes]
MDGKGIVLPTLKIDKISTTARFLILSLENNEMSKKSPFAIQKALIRIGGEPKSVKRLRSGDLLIETNTALQTKSFLLTKSFLNSPLTISLHKTLNSCRGVISETDLLTTPDGEILDGYSDQGVIQSSHPETMARRKGLSPDEIANLLREISVNESNGGKLSCCNLDSDKHIRLSESYCEETQESADVIDNIPVNS